VSDHDVDVRIDSKSNKTKRMRIIVMSVVTSGMLLLGLVMVLFLWKKKQKKGSKLFNLQKLTIFLSHCYFSTLNCDL
jgi:lipopolysaccharide/colanic/teichoic acid biosynthesis glycosyltransferase